jgi:hypothetical protein
MAGAGMWSSKCRTVPARCGSSFCQTLQVSIAMSQISRYAQSHVGLPDVCAAHSSDALQIRLSPRPVSASTSPAAPAPSTQHAVMLSAHYDSALGTVAASDNAVNVATALEVTRSLLALPSASSRMPAHSFILVLGGAEETVLQASHGWISQHKWGQTLRAFINLEGAGGTGRELVFQTGPHNAWLVEAYAAAAPYPHATIIGQEIFQSGIIPSDTDFRIYRDFGRIPYVRLCFGCLRGICALVCVRLFAIQLIS